MRLSPIMVAIVAIASQAPSAIAAPQRLSIPANGRPSNRSVVKTEAVYSTQLKPLTTSEALKAQELTPAAAPRKKNFSNTNTKMWAQTPVTPSPGTESQPGQETPNRIQLDPQQNTPTPQPNLNLPQPTPSPSLPETAPPGSTTPGQPTPVPSLPETAPPGSTTPGQPTPPPSLPETAPPGSTTPGQPTPPPILPETAPPGSTTPGQPTPAPTPDTLPEGTAPPAPEPRVLVSELVVNSEQGQLTPELQNQVYQAISTQPGRTTTRSQLQQDINAVFATGFFSNVRAVPEDTPLGVRVTFVVQPNPVLRKVQLQANTGTGVPSVLTSQAVDKIFRDQYGTILNLRRLQEGIKRLNKVYQDQGYVLAQVVDTQVAEDGTVTLAVAEGVVENINIRFLNKEGEATDDKGKPIRGRTRDFIITRELETKPGQVFNRNTVQRDLQRVYGLGLFEDVRVALNPGQDPRKVDVVVNVNERNSGSVAAGLGFSSASGLFGTVSYQQQNLGGNNQKLGTEIQLGERELLFDLNFTDPWIAGDPYRTSYNINLFRRRTISLIFDGQDDNIELTDTEDRPRVLRLGGGVTFTRPLSRNPLRKSEWTASAGLEYQRVSIRDDDGDVRPFGRVGDGEDETRQRIKLSESDSGVDDLITLQLGVQRDRRNDTLRPTRGSFLRLGVEQSVPIGSGSILLNRLRGSYSQYIPVKVLNFSKEPETVAFNIQAGSVLGDLPPYEAFSLGGTNSVRGYEEGDLASSRSFVQATAEYRFPIFSAVGGALFIDAATDLGSQGAVPGRPGERLDKPGSGFGYGLGIRVQSPLGPIRVDYGLNNEGDSRIHFGIGERF